MHRYTIGKRLTVEQITVAIRRLEAYAREWGDYESFGADAFKVQRVCDSLSAFIQHSQALPATQTLTGRDDSERRCGRGRLTQPTNRRTMSVSFCPPKPKELLRHVSTCVLRAVLGT